MAQKRVLESLKMKNKKDMEQSYKNRPNSKSSFSAMKFFVLHIFDCEHQMITTWYQGIS